ncbi:hypothetical protein FLAG1_09081 [Fusarium langsethiae]|uniref:Uncharacterized protein n=1 Tax=Fusarium langsethiae TaxID=179993 RepID=A0A0N0DCE0_FUSLA|nr:hypothetical protein FLAG1_09081 [Fusarium langsethiae]GKU06144.1 unnamed protein product [Fusarium langsethiae]GKU21577.1 unnamed protein product [Fusarium langsethiae]
MDATYSFRWESYCCFCLFEFTDGDKLIRPLHPSELSTDGTLPTSKTVLFGYKTPVFDPEDKRCISPRKWRWYREVIPAAHLSCHQDWPLVYLKRLWGLVCYQSQPPPCDGARRISVLAKEAASQTKPALQEQARINIKTLLSSQPVPQSIQDGRNGLVSFVVNASKPIWGTDVVFEGVRYGFKIRDLRLVESDYIDGSPVIKWSVLPPKPRAAWLVNLDDRAHPPSYFKFLDCGKPGITGYSACMLDGDLVDLHCHTEGEDLMFYRDGGGDRLHAVWLYFPIEQSERIFEVWRRRKKPRFCRDIPMLRTNKGRVFVLGTHINQYDVNIKYDRLTSFPTAKHARFWFSCREDCVDYLAFDTENRRHNKDLFHRQLEGPFALCSSGVAIQSFATSAPLKDVVKVVPCRSWAPGSTGIVGLVFTYSDGHREAVGQVRLDHLLAPMQVEPTGDMWLGVRELSYGTVVEAMRLVPSNGRTVYGGNTSEAGLWWYRLSWRGRLDWFFWYGRCFVSHHAQPVPDQHASRILEVQ